MWTHEAFEELDKSENQLKKMFIDHDNIMRNKTRFFKVKKNWLRRSQTSFTQKLLKLYW